MEVKRESCSTEALDPSAGVSILVLMEVKREKGRVIRACEKQIVSILVLMEVKRELGMEIAGSDGPSAFQSLF